MGRREGTAKTDDGKLAVKLDSSKVTGGGGTGTNPEQLFAADYAACFIGPLKFVANSQKIHIPADTSIDSNVSFGPRNGQKGSGIAVELVVDIPAWIRRRPNRSSTKPMRSAPYSNASRNPTDVKLSVA